MRDRFAATPFWRRLAARWTRRIAGICGRPLVLQATVKTSIGTGRAGWTITVKK
jgi:hypothetical protein